MCFRPPSLVIDNPRHRRRRGRARRWPSTHSSKGERRGGAPTTKQINRSAWAVLHKLQQKQSTARQHANMPRQTNYANTGGGFVALRRDATFVIFPRPPTTQRQQTDFAARGFTTSKISFQLATDYIVPPQRRVTTRPAQWERGFVAPGAQSPTTSTIESSEGGSAEVALPRVEERV